MEVYNTYIRCKSCDNFAVDMWVEDTHERFKKAAVVMEKLGSCPICDGELYLKLYPKE